MKPRHKRFLWIGIGLLVIALAVTLVMQALNENLAYFIAPSEVASKVTSRERAFRLGGLVVEGSLKRQSDGLTVQFEVTDKAQTIPVRYTGILPDLFKEGKGVVAQGKLNALGVFEASEVFAKHDENYMAPEAAEALRRAGHPVDGKIYAGKSPVVTQQPVAEIKGAP